MTVGANKRIIVKAVQKLKTPERYLWREHVARVESEDSMSIPLQLALCQEQEHNQTRYDVICGIVQTLGETISPLDFLQRLYHNTPEKITYVLQSEDTYRSARDVDELMMIAMFRNDVYVTPQTFFGGKYSGRTIRNHHAIVIDVDNLAPECCRYIVNRIANGKILRPTMVTASGGGLHLYYVFSAPYEGYNYRYEYIKKWKELLTAKIKTAGRGKVDMLSVIQPHRLPGGQTKKGQTVQAFLTGSVYSVPELVAVIGGTLPPTKGDQPNQKPTKPRKVAYIPNGKYHFWDYCHSRLFRERAKEGNRERAMFGLAVVGYKCRVPRAEVEEMLTMMHGILNRDASFMGGTPLDADEVKKAMNGYNQKYVRMTAQTLADYFGWSWDENRIRRNGRDQKTHLRRVHMARRGESGLKIEEWRKTNPDGSKRACIKALGMSATTVMKYWEK